MLLQCYAMYVILCVVLVQRGMGCGVWSFFSFFFLFFTFFFPFFFFVVGRFYCLPIYLNRIERNVESESNQTPGKTQPMEQCIPTNVLKSNVETCRKNSTVRGGDKVDMHIACVCNQIYSSSNTHAIMTAAGLFYACNSPQSHAAPSCHGGPVPITSKSGGQQTTALWRPAPLFACIFEIE